MILETERLTLRPWRETDAAVLYQYAKDPKVRPIAGWPVHTSIENSRQIIRDVLMTEETYAACLKGEADPIGSIGLMIGEKSNLGIPSNEGEIGYWIGVPYWGHGLIPEAVQELIRYAFQDLGLRCIWCGYFDGNGKSRRAQEKCGFQYHHTENEKPYPLINAVKTQHVTCMTKQQWEVLENGAVRDLQ